jgi:hypothetical protein
LYEVYGCQVTRYYPQKHEGVLLAQYIDTFLKLKTEAVGYPAWVHHAEDEVRYIREVNTSEEIAIDKEAIRPSPAKRGLSKFCLNSVWGKLTELNSRTKAKVITDALELYRFLSTPGI